VRCPCSTAGNSDLKAEKPVRGFWAWFKTASGTVVQSTLGAVSATVPDPVLNQAGFWPLDGPISNQSSEVYRVVKARSDSESRGGGRAVSPPRGRPSDRREGDLRIPLMLTGRGERAKVQNEILDERHDAAVPGVRTPGFMMAPHSRLGRASVGPELSGGKNAEIIRVCPMSGPLRRRLTAFLMSFWNKQIGLDDGVFGDQKASLDKCSIVQRPSLADIHYPFACAEGAEIRAAVD
jgi:hypothetical protein